MNESTTKLIEQLAEKFGTTAEHLWGVLVRQAPISAITDMFLFFFVSMALFFTRKSLLKKEFDRDDGFIPWLVWALVLMFFVFLFLVSAESIVAGLFNPEYWALKQLLK